MDKKDRMVERMNCIQNPITLSNNVLIRDKVAACIVTGGQDNVQAVAGQMAGFFGELGFVLPPFPFIGHSLGWMRRTWSATSSSCVITKDCMPARGSLPRVRSMWRNA
ncbi:MAG TPA: hypothetical protein VE046_18880 [Steroidobacteraceae bacterium]|nr:hypothetical protein [Steroidobacteraceae bacterium]